MPEPIYGWNEWHHLITHYQSNKEGVELLMSAIEKAGYLDQVKVGMDVASSEFLTKDGKYNLDFKNPGGNQVLTGPELADLYKDLANKYPIVSIEDPFDQVRGRKVEDEGGANKLASVARPCCCCYCCLSCPCGGGNCRSC